MKTGKFKIGQIIRRRYKETNSPIGPYMIIQVVEDDRVYASVVGSDTPNEMILNDNVYVPIIRYAIVSEQVLEKLEKGWQHTVAHKRCKTWDKLFSESPNLICFYTKPKNYRAIFSIDHIERGYNHTFKEGYVRITIKELIV